MKKVIATTNAPAAIGPYSQAIVTKGLVFVSGQLPIDPSTGEFVENEMGALTTQCLNNAKAILNEVGLSRQNIIKTTVFLADMADFPAMNEAYAAFFEGTIPPARSAVAVKTLPKNARVEIEVIAADSI